MYTNLLEFYLIKHRLVKIKLFMVFELTRDVNLYLFPKCRSDSSL